MNVAPVSQPAVLPSAQPAATVQPVLAVLAAAQMQQTQLLTVLASANQSGLGILLNLLA
jgi:hypothetical protein